MAPLAMPANSVHLEIRTNYFASLARNVNVNVDRALTALLQRNSSPPPIAWRNPGDAD